MSNITELQVLHLYRYVKPTVVCMVYSNKKTATIKHCVPWFWRAMVTAADQDSTIVQQHGCMPPQWSSGEEEELSRTTSHWLENTAMSHRVLTFFEFYSSSDPFFLNYSSPSQIFCTLLFIY